MGDLSELRGLIVTITFLGVLVLLIGLIPPAFYVAGEGRELDYSDMEWEGISLQSFEETWNWTSLYACGEDVGIGGRNMNFHASYVYDNMVLRQYYGFGLLWYEAGTWFNRKGVIVSYISDYPNDQQIGRSQLEDDYEEYGSIEFTVKFVQNQPFQVSVFFTWNDTYSTPSEAWLNDDLWVLIGINFDNISTTYNAWDLIAMLLFFNLPDVHWLINVLIATPIWVTVCYLAYVLIIKAIPLLGS